MKQTLFVFLRHAESEKNIIDTLGGAGKKLTPIGVQLAESVAQHLFQFFGTDACEIICSPAAQAVETANLISKRFNRTVTISNALSPASMGVISGLTYAEIQEQYPEISNSLRKWRACEIEACDLSIPGKEPPEAFWDRMLAFLHSHATGGTKIIVTTRSIMVFAKNLLHNNLPQKGGGYKHTDVSYCEIVSFIWDNGVHSNFLMLEHEEKCHE